MLKGKKFNAFALPESTFYGQYETFYKISSGGII